MQRSFKPKKRWPAHIQALIEKRQAELAAMSVEEAALQQQRRLGGSTIAWSPTQASVCYVGPMFRTYLKVKAHFEYAELLKRLGFCDAAADFMIVKDFNYA